MAAVLLFHGVSPIPAAAVILIAIVAPFEKPIVTLAPGLTLTSVESVAFLAVVAALAVIAQRDRPLVWKTPLTWAGLACLAALLLSAVLSPVDRGNALRFTGRMTAAAVVFFVTLNAITTRALARALVCTLLVVGTVVSVIAVLEAAQVPAALRGLTIFRPGFHVVGGQLRATSTLFYPTIASMYLEVVFVLGLWLLLVRTDRARPAHTPAIFVCLAIIGAGIIATFTRAGLIAVAGSLALVGALQYLKTRRFERAHLQLAALAALFGACVLLSRSPEVLLTRLRTEGSQDWYGARYSAPDTLEFVTGGEYRVPVTLENTGRVVWDSTSDPMFTVSYHWLTADTEAVVQFDGRRTVFPEPVEPNGRITLPINVKAPAAPGRYLLVWDIVHEHRSWLSTEGVKPARTAVFVRGVALGEVVPTMDRLPPANRRADRLTLWRAALRIAAEHPVIGVGPDNFRHVYGRYLGTSEPPNPGASKPRNVGASSWDPRVHANDMYLEVLAGAGVVGLMTLLWLVAASGFALFRRWREALPNESTVAAVLVGVWLVIVGHGLVDSFLGFTTTYVMFALAAGLAFAPGLSPGTANADCV